MDSLFTRVVQVAKLKRSEQVQQPESDESEHDMLERHISELFDLITYGYEENIVEAANRGATIALLCIYNTMSKHRGIIPMHGLLVLDEHITTKLNDYGIIGLMERLKTKFTPFRIGVKRLDEAINLGGISRTNTYAVFVEWDADVQDVVSEQSVILTS
jgi:hypothetical protein